MKAVVVGAGPAGATAAIALARRGVVTTVLEAAPQIRPAGVGLLLQNSPLRALDSLGLVQACAARGFEHPDITVAGPDGSPRATITHTPLVDGGPAALGLTRSALTDVLLGAMAEADVDLRLGTTVATLRDRGDVVEVTCSGGESIEADVLVVADGLHSTTRPLVLPHAGAPAATGQVIWRASAPRPPEVDRYWMIDAGPLGKVGLVPIADDELYLWLLHTDDGTPRPAPGELLRALRRRLTPFGGHVPRVAALLRPDVDLRSLQTLLVPPPWSRGRSVVIGDAVHTTSPHIAYGVGMAIEDSVVLAEVLAGPDGAAPDVPSALAAFTRRRFERCRLVVESSVQLGRWEQEPPPDPGEPHRLTGRTLAALAAPY